LRHKNDLSRLVSIKDSVSTHQGLSAGAVWAVHEIARELGIVEALGPTRQGKLALWQTIARVIDQGSRLSAVRLAGSHAACDVLRLGTFHEDHLYENLDWLSHHQSRIEEKLGAKLYQEKSPELFLYDVTGSYLEGKKNELAAFGYNRDGKKGKGIIVIGLLCDKHGTALSIEVFEGNTQDQKTFASQIRKVAERFGGKEVTLVGDRGMLKSRQVEDMCEYGFHYITAITRPQIKGLMQKGVFRLGLFDQKLSEVIGSDGVRYILRCNPQRAREIRDSRESKYQSVVRMMGKENRYLQDHPRAGVEKAVERVQQKSQQLKISDWVSVSSRDREILVSKDSAVLEEIAQLDGCYVLKTDLSREVASKETVHDRYKDLSLVEWAFRSSKTVHLEMRPVYVRRESRTRGHAFVVMMAYRIIKELSSRWQALNVTAEEGIKELTMLCMTEVRVNGVAQYNQIPQPRDLTSLLLKAAGLKLPKAIPAKGIVVTTKKKLQKRRIKS